MIYKFGGGPEDGRECSIPELPTGGIYRIPLPSFPSFLLQKEELPIKSTLQVAEYKVTSIGDLHFHRYTST